MSTAFQMLMNFVAKPSYATQPTDNNNNNSQDLHSPADTTSSEDSSCCVGTPVDQVITGQPLSQPQQRPPPCTPIVIPTAVTSPIPIQSNCSSLQQQPQQQQDQGYGYPSPGYLSPYVPNVTSPFSASDISNSPDRNRTIDFIPTLQTSSFGSHSSISVPGDDGLYFAPGSCEQDFTISDLLMNEQQGSHQLPPNADPGMLWLTPQHSPGAASLNSQGMQPPPTLALTTTSSVETNNNNYMQVRGSRASSCSQTPLLALGGSSIDSFGSFQAPPSSQASPYQQPPNILENNNIDNVETNTGGAIDIPEQHNHERHQSISSDLFNTINPQYITTPILSISPAQASCSSSTVGNMFDNLVIASPSVQSEHSAFSQQFQSRTTTAELFDEQVIMFQQQQQQQQPFHDSDPPHGVTMQDTDWDIRAWVQQTQQLGMTYEDEHMGGYQQQLSPPSVVEQDQLQHFQVSTVMDQNDNNGRGQPEEAALIVPQQQEQKSQRRQKQRSVQQQRPQRRQQQRARRPPAVRRTTHRCPKCDHTSNRANNMKEHILTHDPERPKNYGCTICTKRFARKYDMERHQKTHERRRRPRYPDSGTLIIRRHQLEQDADTL
ncbi:hypothetical protein BDC45DRAFT_556986 [Circinella umbellata]|nr:hypothetical protein BDC45DRAFT_556986 [Circinella umbellata]